MATEKQKGKNIIQGTKQEILAYMEALCQDINHQKVGRLTANQIGDALSISRTLASQYLNELVKEDLLVKVNSRPVCFFHKEALESQFCARLEKSGFLNLSELTEALKCRALEKKNFEKAIGSQMSISYCVEQCKAAMKYPPDGLPVLLNGQSGTGKTFLAQLMYEYGKDQKLIGKDGLFVTVNCSEYADHPERMAPVLPGLLEAADGGMLLFDEAHNLPQQCQEQLFVFMDRGKYRKPGEGEAWYEARVKLVFATTKNPEEVFLKTLLRRIPVTVFLPPLSERSLEEKEEMIISFLKKESRKIGCNIAVSNRVFDVLMDYHFAGNVRELKNCITTSCATAFLNKGQNETLEVYFYHLPDYLISSVKVQDKTEEETCMLDLQKYRKDTTADEIISFYSALLDAVNEDFQDFLSAGLTQMTRYYDYIVFEKQYANTKISAIESVVQEVFRLVTDRYGVYLSNDCSFALSRSIYTQILVESSIRNWEKEHGEEVHRLPEILKNHLSQAVRVTGEICLLIRQSLDVELNAVNQVFLMLNIYYYNKDARLSETSGIIACHGYSTASSIAGAVNQIVGKKVFEAFDMPLDIQMEEIVKKLKVFIKNRNFHRNLIVLVDMGSLENLGEELKDLANVTVGVINNVSTRLAVDVGFKILQDLDMKEILVKASQANVSTWQLIENKKKDEAILFTSETGAGTADKMRDLFVNSLPKTVNVRMLSYDHYRLLRNGGEDEVFQKYDVLFIAGGFNLNIPGTAFIAIEDIITWKKISQINSLLSGHLDAGETERFNQNLLKNFSLQNVVEHLTILNPDKVLDEVEQAVMRLQDSRKEKLEGKTIVGLYVHLCCLIERLVTKTPIETHRGIGRFSGEHEEFIRQVRGCFEEIGRHYNVTIPVSEIAYIYDYIAHDKDELEEDGEL